MATKEQLEEGIRRAHAAGDAKAVQILGSQLKALNTPTAPKKESWLDASKRVARESLESGLDFVKGVPQGVQNIINLAADPIAGTILEATVGRKKARAAIDAQTKRERDILGPIKQPIARDIGKAVGGLMVTPGGVAGKSKYGRAAYRAMQGALGGAAVEPDKESIATGAAANVVLPPLVTAAVKPAVAAGSKFLSGFAKPTAPPIDLLGKEAADRISRFERLGVDAPTTGMVTRDPIAYGFEQAAKATDSGLDLSKQILKVEADLVSKGQELVAKHGGIVDPYTTGKASQRILETKQNEIRDLTKQLYIDTKTTRGDEFVGRMSILREKMTDPDIMHDADYGKVLKSIKSYMTDLGLISKDGRITKGITLNQAEKMRQFIGGLGNGSKSKIRRLRGTLIDALDDDVVDVIGDDAFKAARASAKTGFDQFQKSLAGKIASQDLAPEKLTDHILNKASIDDVISLKNTYLTGTPAQMARGEIAWKQLGAQGISDLLDSAMNTEGRLHGLTLLKNFTAKAPKLRVLLNPAEFKQIEDLALASRDATSVPLGSLSDDTTAVGQLFQGAPQKLKNKWFKRLGTSGAHSAAFMTGGPAANVALGVAQQTLGTDVERKAAELFMKRVQLASNPKAAAKAIEEAKKLAKTNPVMQNLLEQHGIIGSGSVVTTRAITGDK